MSEEITKDSKVPFGAARNKGRKLGDQPEAFLEWMIRKLRDGDLHAWALAAEKEIERRKTEKVQLRAGEDLERAAEEFLRKHNVNPKEFR